MLSKETASAKALGSVSPGKIKALFLNSSSFLFQVCIYLAVSGLSCSTWTLQLWHASLSSYGTRAQLFCGPWDPNSPVRDRTCDPCIARQIHNHLTTREIPPPFFFFFLLSLSYRGFLGIFSLIAPDEILSYTCLCPVCTCVLCK